MDHGRSFRVVVTRDFAKYLCACANDCATFQPSNISAPGGGGGGIFLHVDAFGSPLELGVCGGGEFFLHVDVFGSPLELGVCVYVWEGVSTNARSPRMLGLLLLFT